MVTLMLAAPTRLRSMAAVPAGITRPRRTVLRVAGDEIGATALLAAGHATVITRLPFPPLPATPAGDVDCPPPHPARAHPTTLPTSANKTDNLLTICLPIFRSHSGLPHRPFRSWTRPD